MSCKLTANIDGIEYNVSKGTDGCLGCVFDGEDSYFHICQYADNPCGDLDIIYTTKNSKVCPKFKPLDRVLVRNSMETWRASFISYRFNDVYYTVEGDSPYYIIPLNEETEYLWNTSKEAPDKYKWW